MPFLLPTEVIPRAVHDQHKLLEELRKSLAEQSLPGCVRYWSRFDLLIIDEFGFECANAPGGQLLLQGHRRPQRQASTALVTNIDFETWSDYLGDPPLAMAFLDRVVDGAILLKIRGKSYRVHRAKKGTGPTEARRYVNASRHRGPYARHRLPASGGKQRRSRKSDEGTDEG